MKLVPILTVVSGHYRSELLIPIDFGCVRGWTESGVLGAIGFARFMRAIQTKTHAILSRFEGHFRGFEHGFDPFADIIPAIIRGRPRCVDPITPPRADLPVLATARSLLYRRYRWNKVLAISEERGTRSGGIGP